MKPEAKLKIANAVRFLQSAPAVSAAFAAACEVLSADSKTNI